MLDLPPRGRMPVITRIMQLSSWKCDLIANLRWNRSFTWEWGGEGEFIQNSPPKKLNPTAFPFFFWNHVFFFGGGKDLNKPDSICHQVTFWPWTLAGGSTWRGAKTAPAVDKFGASSAPQTPVHVFKFSSQKLGKWYNLTIILFFRWVGEKPPTRKVFFLCVNGLLKMWCMFFFFWLGRVALYAQNIAAKHQEDSHCFLGESFLQNFSLRKVTTPLKFNRLAPKKKVVGRWKLLSFWGSPTFQGKPRC